MFVTLARPRPPLRRAVLTSHRGTKRIFPRFDFANAAGLYVDASRETAVPGSSTQTKSETAQRPVSRVRDADPVSTTCRDDGTLFAKVERFTAGSPDIKQGNTIRG
jgi:hypothetical protein